LSICEAFLEFAQLIKGGAYDCAVWLDGHGFILNSRVLGHADAGSRLQMPVGQLIQWYRIFHASASKAGHLQDACCRGDALSCADVSVRQGGISRS